MHTRQIQFKVGDVFLTGSGKYLSEKEILEVSKEANALKVRGDGWVNASEFAKNVRGKLGHYEYKKGLFRTRRTFVAT